MINHPFVAERYTNHPAASCRRHLYRDFRQAYLPSERDVRSV